ncbi:MAG TPA: hypothetical protein VKB46_22425, partial [Pyrinomonadaceae bacterium]|nr:hypothetical protein [Pyrinomonadaceae bacterium]
MPSVRLRLLVALIAVSLLLIVSTNQFTHAQRKAIDTYAITNARIVPVSGATIEKGTVVIRDGLIAAVGANVSSPPDARIIDGTGLTVYPGLIDSCTNLALPEPSPAATVGGGGGGGGFFQQQAARPNPNAPNSTQPVGLQPEVMADDLIKTGGNDIESAR